MARELNPYEIKCAEVGLACFFARVENPREWYSIKRILAYMAEAGLHKAEIKEARKRLRIESQNFDGEYKWRWSLDREPSVVWKDLGNKIYKEECKR